MNSISFLFWLILIDFINQLPPNVYNTEKGFSLMTITIKKKYLILPINDAAFPKKVCFYQEGVLIFDFDCRLDSHSPQYYSYLNVERFLGKTFDLTLEPGMPYHFEQTDTLPFSDYSEPYRPYFHFTAHHGWLNDPNGAFYFDGQYHVFFQHNEAAADWGNMTWGHAVSPDLLHWEQTDSVIFPDELGLAFSGSAWIDEKNSSGLQQGEHPPILLFYTAAGNYSKLSEGKMYTQCLAYSIDGAKTFQKYEHNPIIPHIIDENRDPKVNYCPELESYVMALYLEKNRFLLLTSHNLLDWTPLQEIDELPDIECPDFYRLPVQGTGETKWILSSLSHKYLVGDFKNGKFIPCQKARSLHYGFQRRASQTFAGLPEDIRICASWDPVYMPGEAFRCQLGTPMTLTLRKDVDGYALAASPIEDIALLHEPGTCQSSVHFNPDETYRVSLPDRACDISLTVKRPKGVICLSLYGTQIGLDFYENRLLFQQSVIPLEPADSFTLRLLADKCSLELYVNDGRAYACNEHRADYSQNQLLIDVTSETECTALAVYPLHSIWEEKK